jgi:hypothetical protein
MSTPAPSRSSAPLQPTRQQIDELDALLQRMLSLPVKPRKEDPADADEQALDEAATPDEEAASYAEVPSSYPLPGPEPGAATEAARTVTAELLSQGPPFLAPESNGNTASGAGVEPTVRRTSVVQRPAVDPRVRRGVLLQGLVWSNRVFDRWAGRLGAPGKWLRRPQGRALLGWTGLLCLVAALLVLLKDWLR